MNGLRWERIAPTCSYAHILALLAITLTMHWVVALRLGGSPGLAAPGCRLVSRCEFGGVAASLAVSCCGLAADLRDGAAVRNHRSLSSVHMTWMGTVVQERQRTFPSTSARLDTRRNCARSTISQPSRIYTVAMNDFAGMATHLAGIIDGWATKRPRLNGLVSVGSSQVAIATLELGLAL